MVDDMFKIVKKEFRYWDTLDKYDLFEDLGVHYHHMLTLGPHPVVKLLDPKTQIAHFDKHASDEERAKNEAALDVMVRGKVRYPRTFVIEIGGGFGYGLFAGEDIAEGTFIGEYSGLLSWKGFQPVVLAGGLFRGESQSPYDMDYLMKGYDAPLNQDSDIVAIRLGLRFVPEPNRLRIDASLVGGDTRFVNHLGPGEKFYRTDGSIIDGPNVEIVQGCHQGYFRKWLFAGQDIQRGEELRMDYLDSYWQREDPVSRLFFACKDGLYELYKVDSVSDVSKLCTNVKEVVQ